MKPTCTVSMLGTLRLQVDGCSTSTFRTKKTGALLALLAYHPGKSFLRDEVAEVLWPDQELDSVRNRLRVALSSLRELLEPPGASRGSILTADRTHVSIRSECVLTDTEEFVRLAKGAELASWIAADRLYHGPLLPEFDEEWLCGERSQLATTHLFLLNRIARTLLEGGEATSALDYCRKAIAADPFEEESYRLCIRCLLQTGQNSAAVREYKALESLYASELRIAPSAATTELLQGLEIRPNALDSRPMGHLSSKAALPRYHTKLVGRNEEFADLRNIIQDRSQEGGWISIVGSGGVGKTRLAVEVAQASQYAFDGNIWFIPLAHAHEGSDVVATISSLLECQVVTDLREALSNRFSVDRGLLILDNLEQLSGSGVQDLVDLQKSFPSLTLLTTSRRPLNFEGEVCRTLKPLPVPQRSELLFADLWGNASFALFADRALSARPDLELTSASASAAAQICRLLDGIPLALELAASRARTYSLQELLEQAEKPLELLVRTRSGRESRHESIFATLSWSYELLPNEAKCAFKLLSVFRGGWTLDSSSEFLERATATKVTENLCEDSLVLQEERDGKTRYRFLETVREFADYLLTSEERDMAQGAHFRVFQQLAQEAHQHMEGHHQGEWLDRLDMEAENFRAALNWRGAGPKERAEMIVNLLPFWLRRGSLSEGRVWAEQSLDAGSDVLGSKTSFALLHGASEMAEMQNDLTSARRLARAGLETAEAGGDQLQAALFLRTLGALEKKAANFTDSEQCWRECLRITKIVGNDGLEGRVLLDLASLHRERGEYSDATLLCEQALSTFERLDDPHKIANALHQVGLLACYQGGYERSTAFLERAAELRRTIGDLKGLAFSAGALGQTALAAKRYDDAWRHYSFCLEVCLETQNRTGWEHCVWDLGNAWCEVGPQEIGAKLLGAAEAAHRRIGIGLADDEIALRNRSMEALKATLGQARADAMVALGRTIPLDEAALIAQKELSNLVDSGDANTTLQEAAG